MIFKKSNKLPSTGGRQWMESVSITVAPSYNVSKWNKCSDSKTNEICWRLAFPHWKCRVHCSLASLQASKAREIVKMEMMRKRCENGMKFEWTFKCKIERLFVLLLFFCPETICWNVAASSNLTFILNGFAWTVEKWKK